jgi:hypothetical protein
MALHCLAILGSKNEPLYLCSPDDDDHEGKETGTKEEDLFGFIEDMQAGSSTQRQTTKPPIRLEVRRSARIIMRQRFFISVVAISRVVVVVLADVDIFGNCCVFQR